MEKPRTRPLDKSLTWPLCILVCLLTLAAALAATGSSGDSNLQLTILHTNDLHSHDESYTEHSREIGGFSRIGHMIRLLKKEAPDHTLVIDAGDIFQGTPLFALYKGEVEVNMLNKMGYDIYTIGNHEFDEGPKNLAKQLGQAKFDVINCNMDLQQEPELAAVVKPYTVKTIDGQKIAFVGAVAPDLLQLSMGTGNVKMKATGQDWIQPVADQVHKLKDEGINKIILVTHCGVELDKQLGQQLPEVDAIIGGHSHTRLDKPIVIDHADGTTTTIVQTGCYGRTLGKLDLTFDPHGRVIDKDTHYRLINMTAKIQQDADLKAYVDEKMKPLLGLRRDVLSEAKGDFDNYFRNYPWDTALGDLITDAIFEEGRDYGVQIAFENRGGMRSRIDKGPVTEEKVQEILPFDNKVTFATVNGATLLAAVEHGLGTGLGGRFLDEHGLKIAYDPGKPAGNRLVFALVQESDGSWSPVKKESLYKIAINDFSFKGGEGYDFSKATNQKYTPDKISVALEHYLHKHKVITPSRPSRIVPVTGDLLTVEGKGSTRELTVKGAPPSATLVLLTGKGEGAQTVMEDFPVPLADPHICEPSARSDSSGAYTWHLPVSKLKAKKAGDNSKTWVCVVAQPKKTAKGSPKGRILISYPIELD